jgi:hypothetical protein
MFKKNRMFKSILPALLVVIIALPVSAKATAILSAQPVSATVGLYEKFELRIDLEAAYENPFDPAQVDVQAEFTAPSGKKLTTWGFYNPSQKPSPWMIRFAPTEKGTWQYVVKVKDKEGTAQSQVGNFTAADSSHHGFIRIAPNQRYLMYSDGTPFYGVGLWYNDSYERNRGAITESNLDDLKRRGGNFISFFHTPLETLNTGLGKYDENRCNRLDQVFEWCEQRDIHISWNLWFHSFISQGVWGGGNAWAMKSGDFAFGWVVNPGTSVANESFTIPGLRDGDYDVRLYRTWHGRYLDPQTLQCRDGKLTVAIQELRTTGGHASNIGNDIAFKIVPK